MIVRLQWSPGTPGPPGSAMTPSALAVLVAGPAVDELHRDLVRDVISVGTGGQVRPAPVLEDPEPGIELLADRAIREMERDGGWIAWLCDHDFVVEQAGGKEDAGWRRGIRRDRHGMDVPEDRPWRRLDGHQIVELAVAVDVGGRDHGDAVAFSARGRTCRCRRRRALDRRGRATAQGTDADGAGDGDGDPSGLDDGDADSTGGTSGSPWATRLGSGDADGSGSGSTDGSDPGSADGSGAGACDGSGSASADGWPSCCDPGAVGSWATTGAGTMMPLASSSAVCSRTTPLKRARRR